jgi:uncharacterized protein (DUF1330 family)
MTPLIPDPIRDYRALNDYLGKKPKHSKGVIERDHWDMGRGGRNNGCAERRAIAGRFAIITFPSMDKARQRWKLPPYQALIP